MLKKTVKIVRFYETGGPEVLKLEDMDLPEPRIGEVRLRVQAIGLNRAEAMFRTGRYLVQPKFPSKIGYEAAGVVEAIGPEVDPKLLDKKYSTVPCFDLGQYGVYGEVAIVPAYALAAYPEKLTPSEATSIWMQYLTAYGALIHTAKIIKGDFVLITAASSSVGIAAIEITKAENAVSIAVTRTGKKKKSLLELGASHVIVADEEDLTKRVKEITGGKGARVVFDPIAGKGIEQLAEATAQNGIIIEYGNLSLEPTPFPLFAALRKGLSIRGYVMSEIVGVPAIRAKAEKYVFDQIQNETFKPKIAKTFTLSQIVEAHKYMESNEQIGKIVVTV